LIPRYIRQRLIRCPNPEPISVEPGDFWPLKIAANHNLTSIRKPSEIWAKQARARHRTGRGIAGLGNELDVAGIANTHTSWDVGLRVIGWSNTEGHLPRVVDEDRAKLMEGIAQTRPDITRFSDDRKLALPAKCLSRADQA